MWSWTVARRAETAAVNAIASRRSLLVRPLRTSFDHLVGLCEEGLGDRHPDCLCGFEIDDQLELSRELDRQLTRLCTAQDAVNIRGSTPSHVQLVRAMGQQDVRGW